MPNVFSPQGYKHFQDRVREQQEQLREVGQQVGEAAGPNCDWHDNFEYEDAQRRLEIESSRLRQLVSDLQAPRVIVPEEQSNRVAVGVTVELWVGGDTKTYTLGAFGETLLVENLISYTSPLARAILGKSVGDTARVFVNGRSEEAEITAIFPPSYRYEALIQLLFGAPC